MLGRLHGQAIAEAGGIPIFADVRADLAEQAADLICRGGHGAEAQGIRVDITKKIEIQNLLSEILKKYGTVDILINNAAHDPKVTDSGDSAWSRFENYTLELWN